MSSTYNSTPHPTVDSQRSRDFDNLGLNNNQLPTTPFDSTLLSPFSHTHTISSSASPSYNIDGTPGDTLSDSNYQPSELSELDDEFFGVDFDAGVQDVTSLPSTLVDNGAYQPVELNRSQPDQLQPGLEGKQSSETITASKYPLSPIHTSIPSTPSPKSESYGTKTRTTISQYGLNTELHNSRFSTVHSLAPIHPTTLQLTPDHSGSSHTSAEGVEPSNMAHRRHSPQVTISQWNNEQPQNEPNTFVQPRGVYSNVVNPRSSDNMYIAQTVEPSSLGTAARDADGSWRTNETTGQAGIDPEGRKLISDMEVPTLKEQEEQRRIESRNIEVQEWRSQAGESSQGEDEQPQQSYFNIDNENWPSRPESVRQKPDDENSIAPVSDSASIRENRLVEGQVYYNFKDAPPNTADVHLINQPRQWNDAPSVPYITDTKFQPSTANEAIMKWNGNAETFSLASRAATWGTRRRSEPSLSDMGSVADGSFLKKLSISRGRDGGRSRQNSIFDQGLDRLANIVRKRSDSKLKRSRSIKNFQDNSDSHGNLAPPPRTSSFGRRPTPSINTAFAAMTGPLAAVGTTHARSGSISATATSPKSPFGFARSVINRARSRSDLPRHFSHDDASHSGLADLWRGQGGPPVPNLTSPAIETEVRHPEVVKQVEVIDQDEDEDEEEEQADDVDLKMEPNQQSEPIVADYEGFKAHVLRLNPNMDRHVYHYLISRITHQQVVRYKNLLNLRVKHSQAVMAHNCIAGQHCITLGGKATLLDSNGKPRDTDRNASGLQLMTDFSDGDSNPGEGALTSDTFPQGVPMPPTQCLPAEFECQLCFKAKRFQKPSDWTKHVHEDVQPFTCTYDKCKEPKSFKRKADWVRHENERHRHLEWWTCQVDECRHRCYRKDNFLQHLVREHKLPEPKQKTKAAIKKARGTEPAWIMLERCHQETQNKPQDEHCKFCGRSFATWKKLTVHLAKHMEHISLPILRLVELRNVNANTLISPIEAQNLHSPITPIGEAKMESASPVQFNMSSISPHPPIIPQFSSPFDQPAFYPADGPSGGFGMQAPIPQEVAYDQSGIYNSGFNMSQMDQSRGFGSMDSAFPHSMPDQGYHPQQSEFSTMNTLSHDFVSSALAVSGYQTQNLLSISASGFSFDPNTVNAGTGFQQVPMSRAQGSSSPYGHSPQNVHFYSHP